ncbi:ejaculatory bulb-specific protein 3-like [Cataglyphis hispanica]|uniref:ejaculatory bulb-specific protein 3-like n=1 Tax=Cataglyphis hispanica TaxID=1086592 RepID=UPI002180626A|nr:ejaculatory bulb-specific protein 3-like [Cataglyphis hispanica]
MARLICTIVIIGIALMCVLAEEDKYDDKYDGIDIVEILVNNELRYQYYNCFMGTEPCVTEDQKYFNSIISEAVQTQCSKCTEKQKLMLEVGINWYKKNQPEEWNRFMEKVTEDIKKKAEKNND